MKKTDNPFEFLKAMVVTKLSVTRGAEGPNAMIIVNDKNGDLICRYQKVDAGGFWLRDYAVGEKYINALSEKFEAPEGTPSSKIGEIFVRNLRDSLYQDSESASESGMHKICESKNDNSQEYMQAVCDDDFAQEMGLPRPLALARIRRVETTYILPAAIPT